MRDGVGPAATSCTDVFLDLDWSRAGQLAVLRYAESRYAALRECSLTSSTSAARVLGRTQVGRQPRWLHLRAQERLGRTTVGREAHACVVQNRRRKDVRTEWYGRAAATAVTAVQRSCGGSQNIPPCAGVEGKSTHEEAPHGEDFRPRHTVESKLRGCAAPGILCLHGHRTRVYLLQKACRETA